MIFENAALDADIVDRDKVDELAKLSPMEYDRVRKATAAELGIRLDTLDSLVKNRRKTAKPKPATAVDIKALESSAAAIIQSDDILALFGKELGKAIAGEERNGRCLYLSATSRLLSKTMHVAIKGTSAGGKSELRKSVLEFFPPESVVSFTSLSEKFLIYYEGDFCHKILSMGEAVATDEQDFQDYLLRELMSEGRIRHCTVQKVGTELRPITIEKEGPVSFMVTTTKNKLHPENETRMLSLEIDDSEGQTKAVLQKIAQVEGMNQAGVQIDYEPWRDFQRWLEAGERRVVVPFADAMAELIPPASVRLRRDTGQVIRAIKAHALLHREHRQRDEYGQIVADIANDYAAVRELMNEALAESSGVAVNQAVAQTIDAVKRATANMSEDEGATAQDVGRLLKLDKSAARRRLLAAQGEGFVINLEARKGQPGRYRATDQNVEAAEMLPSVDNLNRHIRRRSPLNPVPPCHRTDNTEYFHRDNGGKSGGMSGGGGDHPDEAGGNRWQAVATPFATVTPLNGNDKMPPVAPWHANIDPPGAACNHCHRPGTHDDPLFDVSIAGHSANLHHACIDAHVSMAAQGGGHQ